jgi:hypothetical protein
MRFLNCLLLNYRKGGCHKFFKLTGTVFLWSSIKSDNYNAIKDRAHMFKIPLRSYIQTFRTHFLFFRRSAWLRRTAVQEIQYSGQLHSIVNLLTFQLYLTFVSGYMLFYIRPT